MIGIGARIIYLGARKMYYGPGMYKGGSAILLGGPVKNQGPGNMVKLACVTENILKGH